ncbi:MAG: YaiO family outer membrane beta-barrel protein [Elusimicrobia bacterium]|nr:YaiO family outer membrane beta-barrel protein [Elusimicrobiota bacterium]
MPSTLCRAPGTAARQRRDCSASTLATTILILLLLLLPGPAGAAQVFRFDAGAGFEDYSFFPQLAKSQWTQISVQPQDRWSLFGGQKVLDRFGLTDVEGTLGGTLRLAPQSAGELQVSLAPDAKVLPTHSLQMMWYQGLGHGITLSPFFRYSHYQISDVYLLTFGGHWQPAPQLEFIFRAYAGLTRFRSGASSRGTPGVLAQAGRRLLPQLWMHLSYAYRKESFQAGAPGNLESSTFQAHAGGAGVRFFLRENISLQTDWQYEGRIPANLLRSYDLRLLWKF